MLSSYLLFSTFLATTAFALPEPQQGSSNPTRADSPAPSGSISGGTPTNPDAESTSTPTAPYQLGFSWSIQDQSPQDTFSIIDINTGSKTKGQCGIPQIPINQSSLPLAYSIGTDIPCSPTTYQYSFVTFSNLHKFNINIMHTVQNATATFVETATVAINAPPDAASTWAWTGPGSGYNATASLAQAGWVGDRIIS